MIKKYNHINMHISFMTPSKVLKRLFRLMINLLSSVLNLSWWNFGFPRKKRSKRERRRNHNKSINLLAIFSTLPDPTHILLKTNKQVTLKEALKDKWCQTNTTKEEEPVLKEVVTVVAEVAQEEVTEAVIWAVQVVINNMLRDHHNNQVLSHNNNNNIISSNNNKCHPNSTVWFHVDTTLLWECNNSHNCNKFHYCLFQRLIWHNSTKLLTSTKRNNLLVTVCILISNKLSAINSQVKLLVCWSMRML